MLVIKNTLAKMVLLTILLCVFWQNTYSQDVKRALFVIDVQTNFIDAESKMHIDTVGLESFLSNVNYAINNFAQRDDLIIYITNEWTSAVKNWATGHVSKKGAPGTELSKEINIVNSNNYSKSKGNALTNTKLLAFLENNEVSEVYVTGLFAEGCVKSTVKGLLKKGFKPVVVEDALGSKNLKKKEQFLIYLKSKDVKIVKVADI